MLWWTLRRLKSADFKTRVRAIDEIVRSPSDKALVALLNVLENRHPSYRDTRSEVVSALGKIGDARAIEPLVDVIEEEPGAKEALGKIDPNWRTSAIAQNAVPRLISKLGHEQELVRTRAAEVLGMIGDPRAVEPLVAALRSPNGTLTKYYLDAAHALAEIGDVRAVEPLVLASIDDFWAVEELEKIDPNWKECAEARNAVPQIADRLGSSDEGTRLRAASFLEEVGDARAVERLILALADTRSKVGIAAASALDKIDTQWRTSAAARNAVPLFVGKLGEKDDEANGGARMGAARALGEIGDSDAIEPLLRALAGEEVRVAAVHALDKVDSNWKESLSGLCARLAYENAARVLGTDPNWKTSATVQNVVSQLIIRIQDEDFEVRRASARALGEVGDERGVPYLIVALTDEAKDVRETAAGALRKTNPRWEDSPTATSAVPKLIDRLQHEGWGVAPAAATILGELGDLRAVEPLTMVLAEGRLADTSSAVSVLESGFTDRRNSAAARDAIWSARQPKQGDSWPSKAAIQTLAEIRDSPGIEPLVVLFAKVSRAESAVKALVRLLERRSSSVSDEQLRTTAGLPTLATKLRYYPNGVTDVCDNPVSPDELNNTLDTSRLRQLARQELVRRGFEA